ncbi:MAG: polysaccharide biosynthesis protein [Pirellulales bacterium]
MAGQIVSSNCDQESTLAARAPRAGVGSLATASVFIPLFAATYCGAYLLRFAGEEDTRYWPVLMSTLGIAVALKWILFAWYRVYEGWTRYVTFHDLLLLGKAITASTVALTLFDAFALPMLQIPRSMLLIDWGLTLVVIGAARALPRILRDDGIWFLGSQRGVPSLIVGANDSGEALLRTIRTNAALNYRVVGFVDDSPGVQGLQIGGVPVVGTCEDLPSLVERLGVEEVLLTAGELPGTQVRRLIETARTANFRVKVLPSFEQLLAERVAVHPRPVAIEDLLCRPAVELDLESLRDWLTGQVVMVTGSAGSIGSEICRQLVRLEPKQLIAVDRAESPQFFLEQELQRLAHESRDTEIVARLADITDAARLDALLAETRPDVIFHAAAYKHVPLMESHCGEAIKNIVVATRNLVDLAEDHQVSALVMISTDKAVNPTSVMGCCKRLAEQYVQARSAASRCRFVTVRFGNVLDSAGSVVPIFREQIARGGPVTVTHPGVIRYFMMIPEAAQLVLQAGAMGKGGEIFVLDMGEPVRILDLAHDMIRLSGLRVGEDIEIEITGLRPGEKLYEELYDDTVENRQATSHPKIMVAASARRHILEVTHDIQRLSEITHAPNNFIRQALFEIVPTGAEQPTPIRLAA